MKDILDLGTPETVGQLLDTIGGLPFEASFGFRQQPIQKLMYDQEHKMLYFQEQQLFITGLHGCSCHPFKTWEDCKSAHNQKLPVGQKVLHRCKNRVGRVHKIHDQKGFVTVQYGPKPVDLVLEHVANLVKVNN